MKKLLLLVIVVGCSPPQPVSDNGQPPKTTRLVTVEHDSHWWIYSTGDSRPFVHHPDCPCEKRRRPLLQAEEPTPVN